MNFFNNRKNVLYGYIFPGFTTAFLILFLIIGLIGLHYNRYYASVDVLYKDLTNLARIFDDINNAAHILGFDAQKNVINFLNIRKGGFIGSEVGAMNLEFPEKWDGPYVQDNPTFAGKEYQVVVTKRGNFIVPGEGVLLPNGKRMGTDIVLDEDADIVALSHDKNSLMVENQPLAVKIVTY